MYFSQHGEDKILYEKYFSKFLLKDPIYFEAGALDGIKYSNTKFFEDTLGWSGLLVEPHPINYEQLKINRPNNFSLTILLVIQQRP